jgi:hypothetical protein
MCELVLTLRYVVWSTMLGLFSLSAEYVLHLEGREVYMLMVTQESGSVLPGIARPLRVCDLYRVYSF